MNNLQGVFTALVTPFNEEGLDLPAIENLVEMQVNGGVNGLVVNGSTAESLCMSVEEKLSSLKLVKEVSSNTLPIIAGISSACTQEAKELAENYQRCGADALMVVMPFYNRPPIEGVNKHFEAVAKSVDIPIILYNVPSRTSSDMADESFKYLSQISNIVALKDASGEVSRVKKYKSISDISVLSGEDSLFLDYLGSGADGIISVISNIIPKRFSEIYKQHSNDKNKAEEEFKKINSLLKALSVSTNPIPIKYCLHRMGMCKEIYRSPLVPLNENQKQPLDRALAELNLV